MTRVRMILLLAIVAAAVGGVWWWRTKAQDPPGWQGYVDADYVKIGPTQPGLLVRLSVARGDLVKAGAPLFAQDDTNDRAARDDAAAKLTEARARLGNLETASRKTEIAQAQADLVDLQAARDRADMDLARSEVLIKSSATSKQQLDLQRTSARSAAAKVEAARAKLEQMRSPTGRVHEIAAQRAVLEGARAGLAQAEWRLAQRHVAAPTAGRIADTYAQPGETLTAGGPVVSLLPPQNIFVRFYVPETALARLHPGDAVAIGCDGCPADLTAAISFVSPQSEYTPPIIYSATSRGKLVYLIEARPPPQRAAALKPGQPVDVRPAGRGAPR